jgi:hypothetical protein
MNYALFAQTVAQAAAVEQTLNQQWTVLGLLAAVLAGVGWFLKWYLPQTLEVYQKSLQTDRLAWIDQLNVQRSDSEKRLNTVVASFDRAVERFESGHRELASAMRALESQLKDKK